MRSYITIDELQTYADVGIDDTTYAQEQIAQAEEIIDSFVGTQKKFFASWVFGQATDGSTSTLVDTSGDTPFTQPDNFFKWLHVEIVAGTNEGLIRQIKSYDKATKTITLAEDFPAAIDSTSVFKIYQLAKFPRLCDVFAKNGVVYKSIPQDLKRAVAAQVEYLITQGPEFFQGTTDLSTETVDNYSNVAKPAARLIAPKARELLRRITNRKGTFE